MIARTVHTVPTWPESGLGGRFRNADNHVRSHPHLDEWICRRILAGMRPQALHAATDGRIAVRTFYRWRKDLLGLEIVTVGGYAATFALRRSGAPTRITPWEPVA